MSRAAALGLRAALAIGLAFALWMFVSLSENPDEQATFNDLGLSIRGLAPDLVIVDRNSLPSSELPAVNVSVVTDRRQRSLIRPVDLRPYIDLTGYGPGDHSVPTSIEIVRPDLNVTVLRDGIDPRLIPIRIEALITRTVPLTLEVAGNLPFSFEVGEPSIRLSGRDIAEVQVSGPQSRVERVIKVEAIANIDQLRASYSAPLPLVAVDLNGNPVNGVELRPNTANVTIPIRPVVGLRLVPVQANLIGTPAVGYAVVDVDVAPQLITLTGSSGVLDLIESVNTRPIDIEGLQTSVERQSAVVFPAGASVRDGEAGLVTVTIRIEPIIRPFQARLPASVVVRNAADGLLSDAQPKVIEVIVSGPSSVLNNLGSAPLEAIVDMNGLGPGTYTVAANIVLPSQVALIGPPPLISVTLKSPPPTPTPEPPSPTALPELPPLPSETVEPPPFVETPTPENG